MVQVVIRDKAVANDGGCSVAVILRVFSMVYPFVWCRRDSATRAVIGAEVK